MGDGSRETGSSTHDRMRLDFPETVVVCIGPPQVQARWSPRTERGKWIGGPSPHQEDICNSCLLAKGKSVFSMKYHGFFQPQTRQSLYSGAVGHCKMNSMIFFDCLFREGFVLFNFIFCFTGFVLF